MIDATEAGHSIWTLTTAEALTAWATVGTLAAAILAAIIAIIGARIALQRIRAAREQIREAREIGWNADLPLHDLTKEALRFQQDRQSCRSIAFFELLIASFQQRDYFSKHHYSTPTKLLTRRPPSYCVATFPDLGKKNVNCPQMKSDFRFGTSPRPASIHFSARWSVSVP
jgi:hypothetical protein